MKALIDNDETLCEDYVIGFLLCRDHWEALQYVLEKRLSGSRKEIEKVDYVIISYLQDIFDKLNRFVCRDYYGAFDFEIKQNVEGSKSLRLIFYRTYEEMMKASETPEWLRHTMMIDLGG